MARLTVNDSLLIGVVNLDVLGERGGVDGDDVEKKLTCNP